MNINISNIIDSHYSQNQEVPDEAVLLRNLSSKEAGISMLLSMAKGDSFTGQVTNITGNQITLLVGNNANITATLSDALSYNIGDTASFTIQSNEGERIVLKSDNPAPNLLNERGIRTALQNANLAVNDTTVNLVLNLMKHNMPIDGDTLNRYVKILNDVETATAEDVVLLSKMNIPVTKENIAALHDYYNYSEGITAKVNSLIDSVVDAVFSEGEVPVPEEMTALSDNEVQNMPKELPPAKEPPVFDGDKGAVSDEAVTSNARSDALDPGADKNSTAVPAKNNLPIPTTVREFISAIKPDFDFSKTDFSDIKTPAKLKAFLHKITGESFFLKPSEINKDNVNRLFERVLSASERLVARFSDNPRTMPIADAGKNIAGDVNFLNELNNFLTFVQLPLKMTEQNAHADLYVYKRPKSIKSESDELKAFLHLNMEHLGLLDIYVTLNNRDVSTDFKVEDEATLDYIEAHLDMLNASLIKLGYNVKLSASVNDGDYSFKKNVIETKLPPVDVKRFSFDVRA